MTVVQVAASKTKAYGPALAWAFLIFCESSIPSDDIPQSIILSQDKLIHMAIFAVLAWLVYRGLRLRAVARWEVAAWVTFLLCLVYGAADELHQYFVPGRSMDVYDLIADVIGAALAIWLARTMERRRLTRASGGAAALR